MLVLHKLLLSGNVVHEDFSKASWEAAMRDGGLRTFWGHAPGDCTDPVERHYAEKRREGYRLGPIQHVMADCVDPDWAGDRGLWEGEGDGDGVPATDLSEAELAIVRATPEEVDWPPDLVMSPYVLSDMIGLCVNDCRDILAKKRKELPPEEIGLFYDWKGQSSLF
jgi:hypothetical protein